MSAPAQGDTDDVMPDADRFIAPRRVQELPGEPDIEYRALFEQLAREDARGLMMVGPRRRVLAMNGAGRDLLQFHGTFPCTVSEVIPDLNFGFAVGDAFHDRSDVWYETYLPDPDRLLRCHVMPILAPSGEPVVAVVAVDDVTRLRHLETVRKDFVANVSHELRTPIASINLLVETLEAGALRESDTAYHFLHRIQVETQAMGRLVEELLELSRLESGTLALSLAAVDPNAVMEDVAERLAPQAREKDIAVRLDLTPELSQVRADPTRLEQVLMNLVHNAIKFTPVGGSVTLRTTWSGPGVQFEVMDTGAGIDSAHAARVFERFYKVDPGRARGAGAGTGLGLAIAQHILQSHGTRLSVVSDPGRGSRFSFALPFAEGKP